MEGLDRMIAWSGRHQGRIEHVPFTGEQHVVQFHLRHNGQAFWSAYPRNTDGAKLSVLPRASHEVPEQVRHAVRNALEGIVEIEWPTTASVPTLPLHLLANDRIWSALEPVLAETLERVS